MFRLNAQYMRGVFLMLNQKGQAFSVFELMIAAIVAVAILFLLLQIIGGINTSTNSSPKDAITNALLSAKTSGGSVDTVAFTIDPQGEISSEDFQEKTGLDPLAVFFVLADTGGLNDSLFKTADAGDGGTSYTLFYSSNSKISVKAKVICRQSGRSLKDSLDNLVVKSGAANGSDSGIVSTATDRCDKQSFIPCCAVVLRRP